MSATTTRPLLVILLGLLVATRGCIPDKPADDVTWQTGDNQVGTAGADNETTPAF